MIRYRSSAQVSLKGFAPFADNLNENNRWVLLGCVLPWDQLATVYHRALDQRQGPPALDVRRVIGAMIVKHKMGLDDHEPINTIQENVFMSAVRLTGSMRTAPSQTGDEPHQGR